MYLPVWVGLAVMLMYGQCMANRVGSYGGVRITKLSKKLVLTLIYHQCTATGVGSCGGVRIIKLSGELVLTVSSMKLAVTIGVPPVYPFTEFAFMGGRKITKLSVEVSCYTHMDMANVSPMELGLVAR